MSRLLASYCITCPLGMLAARQTVKTFTSPHAFDGYVRQLRLLGLSVVFSSPFSACVAVSDV